MRSWAPSAFALEMWATASSKEILEKFGRFSSYRRFRRISGKFRLSFLSGPLGPSEKVSTRRVGRQAELRWLRCSPLGDVRGSLVVLVDYSTTSHAALRDEPRRPRDLHHQRVGDHLHHRHVQCKHNQASLPLFMRIAPLRAWLLMPLAVRMRSAHTLQLAAWHLFCCACC